MPLYREESDEVVCIRVSVTSDDAMVTSRWVEAPGHAQHTLEELYFSAGLETSNTSLEQARDHGLEVITRKSSVIKMETRNNGPSLNINPHFC